MCIHSVLPPPPKYSSHADVAAYAEQAMAALGLTGWSFGWDRAVRRLGACMPGRRRISLSQHFVTAYLREDPAQIHRTLLHELAHALAWVRHRDTGHGAAWHRCCAELGIPDEKASTKAVDFSPYAPRPTRYVLCHETTGEVFREYKSCPRHRAAYYRRCYIPGRKEETLGHLVIRSAEGSGDVIR